MARTLLADHVHELMLVPVAGWHLDQIILAVMLVFSCIAGVVAITVFRLKRSYNGRLVAMSAELQHNIEQQQILPMWVAGVRTIFDHTNTIFFVFDCNGNVAFFDGMELDLAKRSEGSRVGKKIAEIYPDRADLQEYFERGMQGQTVQAYVPFSGGTFQLIVSPLVHAGSSTSSVAVILLDVTELVQVRERIMESEEMFRSLFDNAPYSMVVQRVSDGAYLEANRIFLENSRIARDELPQFDLASLVDMPPEEARALRYQISSRGGVHGQEATIKRRDGSSAHVLYSTLPITYKGEPSLLSMTVDITLQKRASQALLESEERLSVMFNNAPLGLFLSTFSGKIEEANPELVRMLGYESREALIAADPHSLYANPLDRDHLLLQLQASHAGVSQEVKLRRKNGEHMPAIVSAILQCDAEGRPFRVHGTVENLSVRKEHEHALQLWKQRFEIVNAAAQHIFYDYDLLTGTIKWFGAIREVLGFGLRELDGPLEVWLDLLAPEEASDVLNVLERACASGDKFVQEYRLRHKDGHYIFVHDSGYFQFDNAGSPVQMLGIIQNVSSRKQVEIALAASEKRYRTFFESIQDSILILDGPTIVDCNPGSTILFGLSRDKIIGRSPVDFLHRVQDNGEDTVSMMMRALADAAAGTVLHFEWQCQNAGGDVVQVETSLAPMHLDENNYTAALTRDISDHKNAEYKRILSEDKFAKIFNMAPYSISIARLSDGVIMDVNDAFERLTGYARAEAVGRSGDSLHLWYYPQSRTRFLEKFNEHGTVVDYEFIMQKKGGELRTALNSCQAIEIHGDLCLLNIVRDITEAKMVQRAMVQTEKMMSLGGLAAGMAHEINNPLGIILQSMQGLQRRFDPNLDANKEEARALDLDLNVVQEYMEHRNISRYVQGAIEAGQRAADVVGHMLNFSRRTDVGFVDQHIECLVRKAISLAQKDYDLKKMYDFKRIKVNLDLADSLPPVPCVPSEIEQVLLNLLRNAAQAMAVAGTSAPSITVRSAQKNDEALIEVEDNGPGISADHLNRVFEPFYTTKKVGEGTGLGLSVSYFIIANTHQGKLTVESTLDSGTRFTILLPLRRANDILVQ